MSKVLIFNTQNEIKNENEIPVQKIIIMTYKHENSPILTFPTPILSGVSIIICPIRLTRRVVRLSNGRGDKTADVRLYPT